MARKLTMKARNALINAGFDHVQLAKIEKSTTVVEQFENFISNGGWVWRVDEGGSAKLRNDGKLLTFYGDKSQTWDVLAHEMGHYADITQNQRFNQCFDTPNDYVNAVLASEEQAVRNEYQAAKEIYPDIAGKSAQEAAALTHDPYFTRGTGGDYYDLYQADRPLGDEPFYALMAKKIGTEHPSFDDGSGLTYKEFALAQYARNHTDIGEKIKLLWPDKDLNSPAELKKLANAIVNPDSENWQIHYTDIHNGQTITVGYQKNASAGSVCEIPQDQHPSLDDAEQTSSPIVIDLNGDGVKTTALVGSKVYFDHDGNGFAERSGWISPNDGLLALDLNKNGKVDNGQELLGNHSLRSEGGKPFADGYEALAAYDHNQDGKIDAQDAVYQDLRIWQDKNGNGVTDAGELFGLMDMNILAINLDAAHVQETDGAGNHITRRGTVAVADGTSREAADVWFAVNPAQTRYLGDATVSDAVKALPNVRGFGNVVDLRIAMEKDAQLQAMVKDYLAAPDPQSLHQLIYRWAGSDAVASNSRGGSIDARQLVALEQLAGRGFLQNRHHPNPGTNASIKLQSEFHKFADYVHAYLMMRQTDYSAAALHVNMALAFATQNTPDWSMFAHYLQALHQEGQTAKAINEYRIASSLFTYSSLYDMSMANYFYQHKAQFADVIQAGIVGEVIQGDSGNNTLSGHNHKSNILMGYAGNDALTGHNGNDFLDGGEGHDQLKGGNGHDRLDGGAGNDGLSGEAGNDILDGGAGNDGLSGEAGNDILDGGAGNDSLSGGAGSDTYRFGKDFGQDAIYNYDTSAGRFDRIELTDLQQSDVHIRRHSSNLIIENGHGDRITVAGHFHSSAHQIDEVVFANGSRLSVQDIARLVQQGTDGQDQLTATAENSTLYGKGGNDTLNGHAGQDALHGDAGHDHLYGLAGDDVLSGGEGGDNLFGGEGHDKLDGGAGNDGLNGEAGNDVLDGGAGNDSLNGGAGSDTYRFAKGFGQDVINNYDTSAGRFDRIELTDLQQSDVHIRRNSSNLIIENESGDRITVAGHFHSSTHQIDDVVFANGSRLSVQDIARLVQQGTDGQDQLTATAENSTLYGKGGNDTLSGHAGQDALHGDAGHDHLYGLADDDVLSGGEGGDNLFGGEGHDRLDGGAGNDGLNGEAGNDVLDGGAGNDGLNGGAGDDLYIYNGGHDRVHEQSGTDVVLFADLSLDQFTQSLARQGSSLQVRIDNANTLTLNHFFEKGDNVEHFVFADGKSMNIVQIYGRFGETYQGSVHPYDANRVLDEFNKINGII